MDHSQDIAKTMEGDLHEASIARWMRDRVVDTSVEDDGLMVEFQARVSTGAAGILTALFQADIFKKSRREWSNRPLIIVALYWFGGLAVACAFACLWGTLYKVVRVQLSASMAEESISLIALSAAAVLTAVFAMYRYVLTRPHPAVNQHQILDITPDQIRWKRSEWNGLFSGMFHSEDADQGEIAVSDIDSIRGIGVIQIRHPGWGARGVTPVLEVTANGEDLHFGHGVGVDELARIAEQIRDTARFDTR